MGHSAHTLRQNPRRLVRTSTSARTELDAVALRQNALVGALPDMNKYEGWNFNSGNYLFTTDTK